MKARSRSRCANDSGTLELDVHQLQMIMWRRVWKVVHMMKEADDLMKRNPADKLIGKDDSIGEPVKTILSVSGKDRWIVCW